MELRPATPLCVAVGQLLCAPRFDQIPDTWPQHIGRFRKGATGQDDDLAFEGDYHACHALARILRAHTPFFVQTEDGCEVLCRWFTGERLVVCCRELANACVCSIPKVRRALSLLEELGLIEKTRETRFTTDGTPQANCLIVVPVVARIAAITDPATPRPNPPHYPRRRLGFLEAPPEGEAPYSPPPTPPVPEGGIKGGERHGMTGPRPSETPSLFGPPAPAPDAPTGTARPSDTRVVASPPSNTRVATCTETLFGKRLKDSDSARARTHGDPPQPVTIRLPPVPQAKPGTRPDPRLPQPRRLSPTPAAFRGPLGPPSGSASDAPVPAPAPRNAPVAKKSPAAPHGEASQRLARIWETLYATRCREKEQDPAEDLPGRQKGWRRCFAALLAAGHTPERIEWTLRRSFDLQYPHERPAAFKKCYWYLSLVDWQPRPWGHDAHLNPAVQRIIARAQPECAYADAAAIELPYGSYYDFCVRMSGGEVPGGDDGKPFAGIAGPVAPPQPQPQPQPRDPKGGRPGPVRAAAAAASGEERRPAPAWAPALAPEETGLPTFCWRGGTSQPAPACYAGSDEGWRFMPPLEPSETGLPVRFNPGAKPFTP